MVRCAPASARGVDGGSGTDSKKASEGTCPRAAAIAELAKWIEREEGFVCPLLQTSGPGQAAHRSDEAGDNRSGFGLVAAEPAQEGQLLAALPPSLQLRWAGPPVAAGAVETEADAKEEGSGVAEQQLRVQRLVAQFVPPELWDIRLAALLCAAQEGGLGSSWGPYLASLPQVPPSVPLLWRGSQLQEAAEQGYERLPAEAAGRAVVLRSLAKDLREWRAGHPEAPPGPAGDLRALATAHALVSSRAVRMAPAEAGQHAEGLLMPLLDLANHSFSANVELSRPAHGRWPQHVLLTATRRLQAGEELTLNYGRHTNQQLLLDYGFRVDGNPYGET